MITYRPVTPKEQSLLQSYGNRADNWEEIFITDETTLSLIQNCRFYGRVRIGALQFSMRKYPHNPEGISSSVLSNCVIGDHCSISQVHLLSDYTVGSHVTLFNIGEMTADADDISPLTVINENGGRGVVPFPGMTVGEAYLWARYRGRGRFMEKLSEFARKELKEGLGLIGDGCVIRNTEALRNVLVGSAVDNPTLITDCVSLVDGIIEQGCWIESGTIAHRFVLGEHVHLAFGLRLNDTVVGANSTLCRCEVGHSMIFPAHEQHHNNSFLIAALVMGQSNVAAGATIGSNHNGRTADNELHAGRGFWPGLCCSLKHSSRFTSYTLLAKGDFPAELNITLPFSLVNNNPQKNQLEVMPAYWWMYNMYSLKRNNTKFAARDKRVLKTQHIEFDILAPDTVEEIITARHLLREWTSEAYLRSRNEGTAIKVLGHGMEHSKRPTVILKAAEGYQAYEEMLLHYSMSLLRKSYADALPPASLGEGEREAHWENIGGQIISKPDIEQLISDTEKGTINSWDDLHDRLDQLWQAYPEAKLRHAYKVLCLITGNKTIDAEQWANLLLRHAKIEEFIQQQIAATRQKDDTNPFRQMMYQDQAESDAVLR